MMTALSDFINQQLVNLRSQLESYLKRQVADWFIPVLYIGGGAFMLIIVPTIVFTLVERWSVLDSVYFGTYSLV